MMTQINNLPQITGSFSLVTNADWRDTIIFQSATNTPIDLTGIRFRAQVRPAVGSPVVILSLDTNTTSLVNGGTAGTLEFYVPVSAAAGQQQMNLVAPGSYVLDLLAIADGEQVNLTSEGGPMKVTVSGGVTQ